MNAPRRHGARLAWCGAAVSFAAMVTYFLVFTRWPAWRDSGHPSVALAALGLVTSFVGLRRELRGGSWRRSSKLAFCFGAGSTAFLAAYIYFMTYQLPSPDGVIAVGAKAPDFRLKDQQGREVALSELDAKCRILVFFRGHW